MATSKRSIISIITLVIVTVVALVCYFLFTSPAAIQQPKPEHAHVRLQVIVNGKSVNFGDSKYQTPYTKEMCESKLTKAPLHFHNNKNQIVHLHWQDITGGLILKNYGWNLAGGDSNTLGYRFDSFPFVQRVPIHGSVLPAMPKSAKIWVYSGNKIAHAERKLAEFLYQDLEEFLGRKSNHHLHIGEMIDNLLFPKASAHGNGDGHDEHDNILGNIVIFVQQHKPDKKLVTEHFQHLEPLTKNCGE